MKLLLKINRLEVFAKIGECPWEKVIHQKIIINLQAEITKVIDYCSIANYIKNFVVAQHYEFIEELAQALFKGLQKEFAFALRTLEIIKPGCIVRAQSAAVLIQSS